MPRYWIALPKNSLDTTQSAFAPEQIFKVEKDNFAAALVALKARYPDAQRAILVNTSMKLCKDGIHVDALNHNKRYMGYIDFKESSQQDSATSGVFYYTGEHIGTAFTMQEITDQEKTLPAVTGCHHEQKIEKPQTVCRWIYAIAHVDQAETQQPVCQAAYFTHMWTADFQPDEQTKIIEISYQLDIEHPPGNGVKTLIYCFPLPQGTKPAPLDEQQYKHRPAHERTRAWHVASWLQAHPFIQIDCDTLQQQQVAPHAHPIYMLPNAARGKLEALGVENCLPSTEFSIASASLAQPTAPHVVKTELTSRLDTRQFSWLVERVFDFTCQTTRLPSLPQAHPLLSVKNVPVIIGDIDHETAKVSHSLIERFEKLVMQAIHAGQAHAFPERLKFVDFERTEAGHFVAHSFTLKGINVQTIKKMADAIDDFLRAKGPYTSDKLDLLHPLHAIFFYTKIYPMFEQIVADISLNSICSMPGIALKAQQHLLNTATLGKFSPDNPDTVSALMKEEEDEYSATSSEEDVDAKRLQTVFATHSQAVVFVDAPDEDSFVVIKPEKTLGPMRLSTMIVPKQNQTAEPAIYRALWDSIFHLDAVKDPTTRAFSRKVTTAFSGEQDTPWMLKALKAIYNALRWRYRQTDSKNESSDNLYTEFQSVFGNIPKKLYQQLDGLMRDILNRAQPFSPRELQHRFERFTQTPWEIQEEDVVHGAGKDEALEESDEDESPKSVKKVAPQTRELMLARYRGKITMPITQIQKDTSPDVLAQLTIDAIEQPSVFHFEAQVNGYPQITLVDVKRTGIGQPMREPGDIAQALHEALKPLLVVISQTIGILEQSDDTWIADQKAILTEAAKAALEDHEAVTFCLALGYQRNHSVAHATNELLFFKCGDIALTHGSQCIPTTLEEAAYFTTESMPNSSGLLLGSVPTDTATPIQLATGYSLSRGIMAPEANGEYKPRAADIDAITQVNPDEHLVALYQASNCQRVWRVPSEQADEEADLLTVKEIKEKLISLYQPLCTVNDRTEPGHRHQATTDALKFCQRLSQFRDTAFEALFQDKHGQPIAVIDTIPVGDGVYSIAVISTLKDTIARQIIALDSNYPPAVSHDLLSLSFHNTPAYQLGERHYLSPALAQAGQRFFMQHSRKLLPTIAHLVTQVIEAAHPLDKLSDPDAFALLEEDNSPASLKADEGHAVVADELEEGDVARTPQACYQAFTTLCEHLFALAEDARKIPRSWKVHRYFRVQHAYDAVDVCYRSFTQDNHNSVYQYFEKLLPESLFMKLLSVFNDDTLGLLNKPALDALAITPNAIREHLDDWFTDEPVGAEPIEAPEVAAGGGR